MVDKQSGVEKMSERDKVLEQAVEAIQSLLIEAQGHCPTELYEDGYSDACAEAVSVIRLLKVSRPENCMIWLLDQNE